MYSFIYYFAYKLVEKRNGQARMQSGWIVYFAQLGHLFVLGALVKKMFGLKIPILSQDPTINRLLLLPFFIIWIYAVSKYYYKSFFEIKERFENVKMITLKNACIFILLVFIPYVIGIILATKQHG